MHTLSPETLVQCLGWTLLHFIWQGGLVCAVVAVSLYALRGGPAHHRYLTGCAGLLLMAIGPFITFNYLTAQHQPEPTVHYASVTEAEAVTIPASPHVSSPVVVHLAKTQAPAPSFNQRLEQVLPWCVGVWAIGVFGLSLKVLVGWVGVSRLRRSGTQPLDEPWLSRLAGLKQRLQISRPVRLLKSALVEVPTVVGWLHPAILLPASCLSGLTPAQIEAILAHELAHIRRHDYLINLFQCLAETFLFYHPAVWWVSRRIREERENCCDDLAVSICGDRLVYVRTLAILEELRSTPAQLAMAADGAPLLQRIRRLLGHSEKTPTRAAWPLAGIIALVLMSALAMGLRSRAVADQTAGALTNSSTTGQLFQGNGLRTVTVTSNAQAQLEASKRLYKSITESSLPQVNIICKFVEWDEQDTDLAKAFGFLGLQNPSRGKAAFNPISSQPIPPALSAFPEVYRNQITNSIEQAFSGILTEPQYRVVLKMLEKHDGVDLLTPPAVTTESARQAQVSALEMVKILTNGSPVTFKTPMPFGPVLDVMPKVGTNRLEAELSITASVTILLGERTAILPAIRFSQMATSSTVEDGQTVAMAGLQGPGKDGRRKWLMVFVTPTLINSDGTRFHHDDHASKTLSSPSPKAGQTLQNALQRSPDRTNSVHPTKGRQAIISKLDHIRIDSVTYDALPLAEVVQQLSTISRALDTDKVGINFFINNEKSGTFVAPGTIDPATGLVVQQKDIGAATIRLSPALKNVRLSDVLDAIVKNADIPLKYSIEDYAVVFALNEPEPKPLLTRSYRIDRDKFERGIETAMGITFSNLEATAMSKSLSFNGSELRNKLVRQFLQAAGADFNPAKSSNVGKSLFYNDRKGLLMVHTSREDLDVIGRALDALLYSTPANNNPGEPSAVPTGNESITNRVLNILRTNTSQESSSDFTLVPRLASLTENQQDDPLPPADQPEQDHSAADLSKKGEKLYTRVFVVDPAALLEVVTNMPALAFAMDPRTPLSANASAANSNQITVGFLRCFFTAAGADLSPENKANAGKSLFWNDHTGKIMVRGTLQDLEIIASALEVLNSARPQVRIQTQFVEIDESIRQKINFDWLLKNSNGKATTPVTSSRFPATKEASNISVANSATTQFNGMLSPKQYTEVVRQLEKQKGITLLPAPEVTTESGRPAQVQAVDIQTVVTGMNSISGPGNISTNTFTTQSLPFGPALDIVPTVAADSASIQMKLSVTLTELMGYDDPAKALKKATLTGSVDTNANGRINGDLIKSLPLPHFRLWQQVSSTTVLDGHTLVLGGLIDANANKGTKDKSVKRKSLVIFVTPTVIHANGSWLNASLVK